MFKRKWLVYGDLVSDEGFEISFSHKSVYYRDSRGKFGFGYEDTSLSGVPHQIEGERVTLSQSDIDQMVDRVVEGIKASGSPDVDVYRPR
jgi:hypothetical protein